MRWRLGTTQLCSAVLVLPLGLCRWRQILSVCFSPFSERTGSSKLARSGMNYMIWILELKGNRSWLIGFGGVMFSIGDVPVW